MPEREKQLRAQFKRFPPDIQKAVARAFKQFAEDLTDKESRTAKSLAALCAFAQDPKKGRKQLESAFIEDPVVRKTVLQLIRKGRMAKRAAEREGSLQVDDPRRNALRTGGGGRHRR